MFTLNLQWKEFNVNVDAVKSWISENLSAEISGVSANNTLQVHFIETPNEEDQTALNAYWDGLTEESSEATSYQSMADLEADRMAKKASAKAKLEALGLTEDELKAILG